MSKGPATDLDQYDFKPKEILQMIVEMYVAVAREDKARVMTMITEDTGAAPPTENIVCGISCMQQTRDAAKRQRFQLSCIGFVLQRARP